MNGSMIMRDKLLDNISNSSAERIIYICAPAGYGKTVIMRQWLARHGGNSAIVTLDEYDNDTAHFCVWFCAALRKIQPNNSALHGIAEHPAFDSEPIQFASRMIAALHDGEKAELVIDDLHFVHNESILRLLISFLKRLPSCFQIVLISRYVLPRCFSDLIVKGHLTSVTAEQLLFSSDEITQLYNINGVTLSEEQAEEIQRFTGGWAIGVRALLLSGGVPHGESLEYLDEFIRVNIWQRWDERVREFLLKTAAVWEMTPSLCTALTGEQDSAELLEQLLSENVFISRTEHGVYRYHRLFHDFLTKMLEKDGRKCQLLEKAGFWYLSQRDFYSAIEYFIRCESHKGIVKCFVFLAVIDRASFIVDKLLPIFDNPIIRTSAEKFPLIYSAMSWAAFLEGHAAESAEYADKYYKKQLAVLRHDPRLAFYIIFTRLFDHRVTLREILGMMDKIPKALIAVTPEGIKPSIGIINQNMPLLHKGTRDFSELTEGDLKANVAEVLKAFGGLFGDEAFLLGECIATGLLYEQGQLDKAHKRALAANAAIDKGFASETKFCAMSALVCVLDALNHPEQADAVLARIGDMIEKDKAYNLSYNFSAMSVRRKFIKGDTEAANRWLMENEPYLNKEPDFYRLYGHITTCEAYITKGEYDSAIILLTKILKLVTAYNRPLDIIETRIILAVACWNKKRTLQGEAIKHLEQAVSLAYRYGYTQVFINMGAELSGLLLRVQRRAEQSGDMPPASFVKMLYIKSAEHIGGGLTSGQTAKTASFTDKQTVVMRLLCEGKSYREMTEVTGIKITSLRSRLSQIYKKLDVTNEVDAIKKIKAHGLLDEA